MTVLALQAEGTDGFAGMYSRKSWGGPVDPFILVKFLNDTAPEGDDPIASLVIFEWRDGNLVGIPDPDLQAQVRRLMAIFITHTVLSFTDGAFYSDLRSATKVPLRTDTATQPTRDNLSWPRMLPTYPTRSS